MNHDDDDNNDILSKELDSWNGFEFSLREENRILFHKMLYECREHADAVNSKGDSFSVESLFMALILQHQKMIDHLIDKLSKYKTNIQH
jgi:hypothetical protein